MADFQFPVVPTPTLDLSSNQVSWAETELVEETLTFLWTIKDFFALTSHAASPVRSPAFDGRPRTMHKWQIRIRSKRSEATGLEYISAHLYLLDLSTGGNKESPDPRVDKLHVRFLMALLDADGNHYRPVGGALQQQCTFQKHSGWGYDNWLLVHALRTFPTQLLPNGNLNLKCQIWINMGFRHRLNTGGPWQKENLTNMSLDFGKLFADGTNSDVTVQAGQLSLPVHKAVLIARSPVFLAMFSSPMQENLESVVHIEDFDCDVVKGMMEFLYTGKLAKDELIARAPDLFQIADKYDVVDLRDTCVFVMAENITVDNAVEVLWLAETHNCIPLKNLVMNFMRIRKQEIMQTDSFKTFTARYPHAFVELFMSLL